MRQRALTVAFVLAALGVAAAAQAQEPQAKPRELRVMSYNIKHGQTNTPCTQPPRIPGQDPFPDCNLNLQASIDVIRAQDPDIVGMEEIDRFWARSGYVDEPARSRPGLGMEHYCYAANLNHPADSHSSIPHQYGVLIVSRFPILECTNTLCAKHEQRRATRPAESAHQRPRRPAPVLHDAPAHGAGGSAAADRGHRGRHRTPRRRARRSSWATSTRAARSRRPRPR